MKLTRRLPSYSRFALGIVWMLATGAGVRAAERPTLTDAEAARLRSSFRRFVYQGRKPGALNARRLRPVFPDEDGRWRFTAEAGHDVFVTIRQPSGRGRHPVLLFQHFHGADKYHPAMRLFQQRLAAQGFMVVSIDARYKGERARATGSDLHQAIATALEEPSPGLRPFLFDTVFDLHRTIDFLVTTPGVAKRIRYDEVNGERSYRVGAVGISMGGLATWLLASFDMRVQAAVPIMAVTEFEKVVQAREIEAYPQEPFARELAPAFRPFAQKHCDGTLDSSCMRQIWQKLMPELVDDPNFACGGIMQLIAPRPLMIISHNKDRFFPLAGARIVVASTRARYEQLTPDEADELLQHREFRGVHGVGEPKSFSDMLRAFKSAQRVRRDVEIAGRFLKDWLGEKPRALAARARLTPAK